MKSNTSYLVRLFGYVSSSIPYFLISFFGFILFAAAQVGAAEWLRRIVDFIENPNYHPEKYNFTYGYKIMFYYREK